MEWNSSGRRSWIWTPFDYSLEELFIIFCPFLTNSLALVALFYMFVDPTLPFYLISNLYGKIPFSPSLIPLYGLFILFDFLFYVFYVTTIFFGAFFMIFFMVRLREEIQACLNYFNRKE
jgi:hypothetical protein